MTGLCDSLGLEEVMPPTMAFSRQGIECIRSLGTVPVPNNVEWEMQRNEDMAWVRTLAASGLRQGVRAESNFIYHIHGANLSTGSWLLTDERKPATSTLNAANDIEGWSADEEAELLSTAVRDALTSLPAPQRIVEIGSYCGRSTVVTVSYTHLDVYKRQGLPRPARWARWRWSLVTARRSASLEPPRDAASSRSPRR